MFARLSLLVIAITTIILCSLSSPISHAAEKPAPRLFVDAFRFEFGDIEESTELKHSFKITNRGSDILLLKSAQSSCGCTVPKLTVKQLKPGESTDLLVVIDTAMKQGRLTKTVTVSSNDPISPELKLYLSMNVKNPHDGLTEENRIKIFTDNHCNSCHVAKGNGLFGKDLYEADCAMCHGKAGLGAGAPQLLGPYETAAFKNAMTMIASQGSQTHRSMPGFLVDAGGPLSKQQIDSILQYLAQVSKQKYYPGKIMPQNKTQNKN